ncbi:hypothetical protein C0J52_03290 [Blattella germanica]|nr:hypothetical protein C0J52_03290 [Blattella germanica]
MAVSSVVVCGLQDPLILAPGAVLKLGFIGITPILEELKNNIHDGIELINENELQRVFNIDLIKRCEVEKHGRHFKHLL